MHDTVLGSALPSPAALAYLGDARHSLFVREMLVRRGISKSSRLNELALSFVTAEAQARAMKRIEPLLLEDEREVYRRAANSGHLNKPKHARGADYRAATGFEAVIGMLHWIGDTERLELILNTAHEQTENKKSEDFLNDTEN